MPAGIKDLDCEGKSGSGGYNRGGRTVGKISQQGLVLSRSFNMPQTELFTTWISANSPREQSTPLQELSSMQTC